MSDFVPILTAAISGCTRCGCAVAGPLIPVHRKVCPGTEQSSAASQPGDVAYPQRHQPVGVE